MKKRKYDFVKKGAFVWWHDAEEDDSIMRKIHQVLNDGKPITSDTLVILTDGYGYMEAHVKDLSQPKYVLVTEDTEEYRAMAASDSLQEIFSMIVEEENLYKENESPICGYVIKRFPK